MRRIISRSFIPNKGGCDVCVGGDASRDSQVTDGIAAVCVAGGLYLLVTGNPILGAGIAVAGGVAMMRPRH